MRNKTLFQDVNHVCKVVNTCAKDSELVSLLYILDRLSKTCKAPYQSEAVFNTNNFGKWHLCCINHFLIDCAMFHGAQKGLFDLSIR